jgi:hypothetical protein
MPEDDRTTIPDPPSMPTERLDILVAALPEVQAIRERLDQLTARLDLVLTDQAEALRVAHALERLQTSTETEAMRVGWVEGWRAGWSAGQANVASGGC